MIALASAGDLPVRKQQSVSSLAPRICSNERRTRAYEISTSPVQVLPLILVEARKGGRKSVQDLEIIARTAWKGWINSALGARRSSGSSARVPEVTMLQCFFVIATSARTARQ